MNVRFKEQHRFPLPTPQMLKTLTCYRKVQQLRTANLTPEPTTAAICGLTGLRDLTCELYIRELGEVSSSIQSLQLADLLRKVLLVGRSCIYDPPRSPERAKEFKQSLISQNARVYVYRWWSEQRPLTCSCCCSHGSCPGTASGRGQAPWPCWRRPPTSPRSCVEWGPQRTWAGRRAGTTCEETSGGGGG